MKLSRFYLIAQNLSGTDMFTVFFQRSVSTCIRTQCRVAQLPENIHEALILNSKNPLLTVWIGDKVSVSCVIVSQAEEGAAFRSSRKFFLARVFWLAARTAEENGTCVLFLNEILCCLLTITLRKIWSLVGNSSLLESATFWPR